MGLGWVKGQLRWSAHPLGGAECRHHTHHLAFAPIISEMGVRLWPFRILFCNCLNCACMQLFVVLIESFVLLLEETLVQVQAHKWRLSGLSLFQRHVSTSGATEFTAQTAPASFHSLHRPLSRPVP